MSLNPYSHAHDCERESVAAKLMQLDRQQRTILRAYIRMVEYGSMSLAEWFKNGFGVAESSWRKPWSKGGRYYGTKSDGNPFFRSALTAYSEAYLQWEITEESKSVRQASRIYKLAAPDAARTHVRLMTRAEDERVQLLAANEVANRASVETAPKGSVQHNLPSDVMSAIERAYGSNGQTDSNGGSSGDAAGSTD